MKTRIEVGDSVLVYFSTDRVLVIVDYMPFIEGEPWIIIDDMTKMPIYVNNYDYIILRKDVK
jgi:hypothetical protein